MKPRDLLIHCIYCGATLPVSEIFYYKETPEIQAERLAFEEKHLVECGAKPIGMMFDIVKPSAAVS